jgi:hypothetical protein
MTSTPAAHWPVAGSMTRRPVKWPLPYYPKAAPQPDEPLSTPTPQRKPKPKGD